MNVRLCRRRKVPIAKSTLGNPSDYSLPLDSPLVELLENCIENGLILSTSLASLADETETKNPQNWLLARLCYHFLRPKEAYSDFLRRFPSDPGSLTTLFNSLIPRCKLQTPTMVVFHLDETNTADESLLERIDRAVTNLFGDSDFFFVFVQTGVRTTIMEV